MESISYETPEVEIIELPDVDILSSGSNEGWSGYH